jgi:hypothetical protein
VSWCIDWLWKVEKKLSAGAGEGPMIRMFVRHDVADYGTWRRAYDAFDAERRQMGVVAAAVYLSAEKDRDITISHDFETLEAAKAFIGSQRLREVMGAAGVTSVPTIWFTRLA